MTVVARAVSVTCALVLLVVLAGAGAFGTTWPTAARAHAAENTTSALFAQEAQQSQQAQAASESVGGTISTEDGAPVSDVRILVESAGGELVGEGITDDNGTWQVALPGPGSYRATLVEDSLPDDAGLRNPERATLEFDMRPSQERTLLYPLGEQDVGFGRGFVPRFLQALTNGVKFGLIIAMTAIGLSLIFGTTGLINFAHGEMVTFGAVVAFLFNASSALGFTLHLIPSTLLAIIAGAGLGWAMERGLWRNLRSRKVGLFQMLVISIGLMLLLRHVVVIFYGSRSRPFAQYAVQAPLQLGPIRTTARDLVVIALSIAILVGVAMLLERTRLGKAMRAVADNRNLAESSGIDVQQIVLLIWVMGGGLAAAGGVFLGTVENVSWLMGFRLLLLMFAGVILGGLGTAYGAMVGSLIVGVVTEVSTLWFAAELKFVWALFAMIIILLVRPQGVLGIKERIG